MLSALVIRSGLLLFLVSLPALALAQQGERDWPQFRGRNVDGISTERDVFHAGRIPALEVSWKQPIGSGYSGISIAGNVAVTMFTDGESNFVIAFDAKTGRERWRFPFSPIYKGHDGSYDGPMSTPLIDGNLTVALGPSGRLFALDNLDGELVWSTDLVNDVGASVPLYGFATSPVLLDGTVIVQIGSEAGTVAGFDPETGERRWSVGTDGVNAQTPIPVSLNGRRQLLASGDTSLMKPRRRKRRAFVDLCARRERLYRRVDHGPGCGRPGSSLPQIQGRLFHGRGAERQRKCDVGPGAMGSTNDP